MMMSSRDLEMCRLSKQVRCVYRCCGVVVSLLGISNSACTSASQLFRSAVVV
jgi:hypothetical protein